MLRCRMLSGNLKPRLSIVSKFELSKTIPHVMLAPEFLEKKKKKDLQVSHITWVYTVFCIRKYLGW